jgi:hypothetical protein
MGICVKPLNVYVKYPISKDILRIQGTVLDENVPLPCRVRLYDKTTGTKFSEVISDAYGNFSFQNLDRRIFFVVVHDPKLKANAVIADFVQPST